MPQFTLHRNHILRTTKGHAIHFKKGEPTNVPPVCVEDAVAIGAQPVDPEDIDVLGDEAPVEQALSPEERKAKVFEAFGIMKTRGERSDFGASGSPNVRPLQTLTGFEVSSKERDTLWLEYRELEQAAHDQAELDHKTQAEDTEATDGDGES